MLSAITHSPLFLGALSGLVSAAVVDYAAFRNWKSFQEVLAYDWGIALWRWFQGAVAGLVTASGINVVT